MKEDFDDFWDFYQKILQLHSFKMQYNIKNILFWLLQKSRSYQTKNKIVGHKRIALVHKDNLNNNTSDDIEVI